MITHNLWTSAGINSAADLITEQNNLTNKYGSYLLSQVKSHLEGDTSLSEVKRFIVSDQEAYLCILLMTCKDGNNGFRQFSDAPQLVFAAKLTLEEAENKYIDVLIDDILANNSINLTNTGSNILSSTLIKSQIHGQLKQMGVKLDNTAQQVMDAYYTAKSIGPYHYIVDCYLNTGDVNTDDVDQSMKDEMARYLYTLNLNLDLVVQSIDQGKFKDDNFDGYLSQAWTHALRVRSGDNDPINQVFGDGAVSTWDFSVDYFDDAEDLEVNPENIKLTGALYYIHWLDELGVFDAVNYITLMWARGSLDVTLNGNSSGSGAASKLYKYFKRNDSRLSKEERMMIYRQVFGLGNVPVLDGGIENRDFARLQDNLMNQVVEYINKIEGSGTNREAVSIEGLSQAIIDLRHNADQFNRGKVAQDAHELHAQLQDCFNILRDPEIAAQLAGGRHRNMWTVLERVLRDHLGKQPNISAYKTAAVEGNRMFNIIADFNHNRRHSEMDRISALLKSAEAFIVARSQMAPQENVVVDELLQDTFEDVIEDDFENWD